MAPLTIDDIARLSGVSKTTVSLVINGKSAEGGISVKTRERVQRVVRHHGFIPSRYARGLRSRRSQTIGLVAPDLVNPFFARLNHALEQTVRRGGYQLLVGCSEDDRRLEAEVVANLVSHRIDGPIVASTLCDEVLRSQPRRRPVPTVFVDREIAVGNASSVATDNRQGAFDAVARLCDLGAKQVVYLGGPTELSTSRHRFEGYRQAMEAHGLTFDPSLVGHGGWVPEEGRRLMTQICTAHGGLPEALFTASYTLLEGVLAYLKERHGGIPAGLGIATFDDHPLLDFLGVPITAVRQDTERMAREAFEMLERALAGASEVEHRRIPPVLVIR